MRVRFGRLGFLLPNSATVDHWRVVHEFIDSYVDQTLKESRSKPAQENHVSLLRSLAHQTDIRLEMRNQVIQGMMAASESVPILLSNTIFLLSRHPEVWTQLRQEATSVKPGPLTVDSVRQINFVQNILNEGKSPLCDLNRNLADHLLQHYSSIPSLHRSLVLPWRTLFFLPTAAHGKIGLCTLPQGPKYFLTSIPFTAIPPYSKIISRNFDRNDRTISNLPLPSTCPLV